MTTLQLEGTIVEKGEFKVVGFERVYGMDEMDQISKLWDDHFLPRKGEIKHPIGGETSLGICLDVQGNPSFRYVAGAVVTEIEDVPAGMISFTLPPQRYAVFTVKGDPLAKLGAAFDYINGVWLPENGFERTGECLSFELYDTRFNPESDRDNSEIDIYVAIK